MPRTCLDPDCKKRPKYNVEGATTGVYCSAHKTAGMVNVKDKTCLDTDCKKIPAYNVEGATTGLYCSAHKTAGMVNVKDKTCLDTDCKKIPAYNVEGATTGLYCSAHKTAGMVDVKNKTCHSEWCATQVTEKYDGYCLHCYMHLFPDKPVARNYKTKEFAVVEFVKNQFADLDWVCDRQVADGC